MDYSQFGYPKYETPLLQAYSDRFGAAFIALHPFFQMPGNLQTMITDAGFLENIDIRQSGQPVYWQSIMQAIDCEDLRQFYRSAFNATDASTEIDHDREIGEQIDEYVKRSNIYYPMEGFFAPLLIEPITQYIAEKTDSLCY